MEFVSDFLANHQMLQANDRPIWRVLKGGSNTYVKEIIFNKDFECKGENYNSR